MATRLQMQALERPMKNKIREVVVKHAGVEPAGLQDETDLYRAGMTSFSSVALMIALENEFGVEFPEHMLNRTVFESIDSIAAAIGALCEAPQ
jgi:acyl carrier protein